VKLLPTPTARDGKDSEIGPAKHRPDDVDTLSRALVDFGHYAPAVRRWERTLGRSAPSPTRPSKNGKPQLSPAFTEWMMVL
jgi:DNA (cytosine-5)-methyltransferase 1